MPPLTGMGCDIKSWLEAYDLTTDRWAVVRNAFPASAFEKALNWPEVVSPPFETRNYALFGFLAGVRNYACCEPLDKPRGLPVACDSVGGCSVNGVHDLEVFHSHSWFLLSELLSFDYEKTFWNRRIEKDKDGGALAHEGEGVHETYRQFLGLGYFDTLEIMKGMGQPDQVRVVFCFGD